MVSLIISFKSWIETFWSCEWGFLLCFFFSFSVNAWMIFLVESDGLSPVESSSVRDRSAESLPAVLSAGLGALSAGLGVLIAGLVALINRLGALIAGLGALTAGLGTLLGELIAEFGALVAGAGVLRAGLAAPIVGLAAVL